MEQPWNWGLIGLICVISLIVFTIFSMLVVPVWQVWASKKEGEAEFAKAQNEQRVQLSAAKARLEAAETNKKAAIVEAEAVAEQIKEIGENLQKHDLYLKWQWIQMMEKGGIKGSVIYVPTEAGLPILEAGKRS